MKRRKFLGLGALLVGGLDGLKSLVTPAAEKSIDLITVSMYSEGLGLSKVLVTINVDTWREKPETIQSIFSEWFRSLNSCKWPRAWGKPTERLQHWLDRPRSSPDLDWPSYNEELVMIQRFIGYLGNVGDWKTWGITILGKKQGDLTLQEVRQRIVARTYVTRNPEVKFRVPLVYKSHLWKYGEDS